MRREVVPSALVEEIEAGFHQPWVADDHVEFPGMLGDPFLAAGQRDTGTQNADLELRFLKDSFQPSLNIVLVRELDVDPDLAAPGFLGADQVDQFVFFGTNNVVIRDWAVRPPSRIDRPSSSRSAPSRTDNRDRRAASARTRPAAADPDASSFP